MASFMSWLLGTGSGSKEEELVAKESSQVAVTSKSKTNLNSKQNKGKARKRTHKANEEPAFNTQLSRPIEDVIEETLNEEKSDSQSDPSTSEKVGINPKKKHSSTKEKAEKKSEDDSDFIFVRQTISKKSNSKQYSTEQKLEGQLNVDNSTEGTIGYSFLPVKEKNRKVKNKSILEKPNSDEALTAGITQGITKKKEAPKTSIIDHFTNRDTRISSTTFQEFPPIDKVQSKQKTEYKESKKVTSQVSYANIVTNSVPADYKFEEGISSEPINCILGKETSSSIEVLSSQDFEETASITQLTSEYNINLSSQNVENSDQDFIDYEQSVKNCTGGNTSPSTAEKSIEVIRQSEKTPTSTSIHFEKYILPSAINVPEPSTENILESNFIESHFTQVQSSLYLERKADKLVDQTIEDIIKKFAKEQVPEAQLEVLADEKSVKQNKFHSIQTGYLESLEKDINSDGLEYIHQQDLDLSLNETVNKLFKDNNFQPYSGYQKLLTDFTDRDHSGSKENVIGSSKTEHSNLDLNQEVAQEVSVKGADLLYGSQPVIVEQPFQADRAYTTTENNQEAQTLQIRDDFINQCEVKEDQDIERHIEDQIQVLENQLIDKHFTIEKSNTTISGVITDSEIQPIINLSQPEIPSEIPESILFEQTAGDIKANFSATCPTEVHSADLNMVQVRVLTLNDKEHQDSTIYRIEKKFTLQFRLGPSLLGRKIKLYCNYPLETNGVLAKFDRDSYQLLDWCQDEGCKNADDTALFTQIIADLSGSFHYYFIYENEEIEQRQGSGYFIVDPILKYGANELLPLDCIQSQTVLSKHLGPLSTWENKLRVAKESGYNVIHFTPIQELGSSKSCYSLSEQLKLNPLFNEENGKKHTFEDIAKLTSKMRKEWKVLSICDIVLNHTANESEWIKDHPEATYNCVNCPYMRPAYLLDAAFHHFSMDVKKGLYEDRGIPTEVSTEDHLNAIRYHFKLTVLEPLKIHEFFIVDVNKHLERFLILARRTPPITGIDNQKDSLPEIEIIQDPEFRRLGSTINLDLAIKKYSSYRLDCFDEETRVKKCAEDLKAKLDSLNEAVVKEIDDDLNVAVENVLAGIRYFRVQADGPKHRDITVNHPLVYRYFTDYGSAQSLDECEEVMFSRNGGFIMAHNGWVMGCDPLKNFADPGTKTYIRRELVAWGDSVKLRYGNKPEDSPFLWDYMRKYVEQTVQIFDGVRLDNCHSTPIPVAEYLLDCARRVRPDLYVVAELFTNSDLTDNIFVNRLGITSLIREAMSAWDSHEEGRLVYRYGGVPVGSFYQPNLRPLVPMVAHALFLDLTHDNPSPIEKRSVFDLLPSTALVNMACCASGSNRGYDELVPHHIHVVEETRQYTEWTDDETLPAGNAKYVNNKFGIIAAKRALNELHFNLGNEGYNQVYVDQMDPDIVAVTRHNPDTHTSYVLVAFTAFNHPDVHAGNYQRGIKPLKVEGVLDEIVLEASLSHIGAESGGSKFSKFENFTKDPQWINGLSEYRVSVKQHIPVSESDFFEEVNSNSTNVFQLNFKNFKPGSIAVVKVSLPQNMKESVSKIRSLIKSLSIKKGTGLSEIIGKMTLADLNRALYRCDQEERDEGNGFDTYNIPNFGPMVYCGLQGFMSLLANIRPNNDLGHPFCANLRDGNWMIEYIWKRLKVDEGTKEMGQWLEENTKYLHSMPRYLIPCYFDIILTGIYIGLLEHTYNLMSNFVKYGSTFVRGLSLGSLQFGGYIKSADLPLLSPNLAPPKPPTRKNQNGEYIQSCVTLSAGLPHFAVGYMRNWGRDTFIALRGLFILTGRFEEARQHILGYAACLRHGLIPNLLDGGRNPRFNCRDAIWWWLYCIKSYCEEAPNGTAILSDLVSRIFPTDDSPPQPPGAVDQPLYDVIQEGLKVHFQGLKFRERNAGRQIDEHMNDAGFNNQIGIHPETGFVFGGNQWNCGTWMDKMGSSDKAGNRGKPATPRDGSAVELIGLSKAAVSWLWKLNKQGKYPYEGVERVHKNGSITKWTFKEWADKIQHNFEKMFWIGPKLSANESRPDLINKKNIYKDSVGASQPWTDYQLRSNFPIAMVAAPEMFNPQHAWAALEQAEKHLLGPLGMKTLDPEDWNYRGDYDNSNDSTDPLISHGFNYHQGPEWVWPIGFFLRAKLIFAAQNEMLKQTLASTKVILSKHFTELQTSPWRGLPELTNSNGSYCRDSSSTQAWSMSCVLEVLYDLQQIESKQIIAN